MQCCSAMLVYCVHPSAAYLALPLDYIYLSEREGGGGGGEQMVLHSCLCHTGIIYYIWRYVT